MTKLHIQVSYDESSCLYWLHIWKGADVKWFLADNKDRLHDSRSYSAKRIAKRRDKQEAKWTRILASRAAVTGTTTKEV